MFPSVRPAFMLVSKPIEGRLSWMYPDDNNAITTGMGNKIDSVAEALRLPWKHGQGGPLASPTEIQDAWNAVKGAGLAGIGGGSGQVQALTDLRLDESAIDDLINGKLDNNENVLRKYFPDYTSWPADTQLALHLMAWGLGAAFSPEYPKFTAAVNQLMPDFNIAALQSWMKDCKDGWVPQSLDTTIPDNDPAFHPPTLNSGLRPRNLVIRQLFLNGVTAIQSGTIDQILLNAQAFAANVGDIINNLPGQINPQPMPYNPPNPNPVAVIPIPTSKKSMGIVAVVVSAFGGLIYYIIKKAG